MPSPTAHPNGALSGIRVADFSWVRAGPQTTRSLALFGAEVIRIEWPEHVDIIRLGSAWAHPPETGVTLNTSADFSNLNVNKLSLCINIRRAEGLAYIRRLIAVSDVVVENFRPHVMADLQLGYEQVRSINPAIVYTSMAGLGQTGPMRDYKAFGPSIQAMCGLTQMTGLPGNPPAGWGYSYMDLVAGYHSAIAILAALRHRAATGKGQYIDLAQIETGATMTGAAVLDYTANGRPSVREGVPPGNRTSWPRVAHSNAYRGPQAAPHNAYRCKGGGHNDWCAISCANDEEWLGLVRAMGSPSWASSPRFRTREERLANQEDLDASIEAWTKNFDKYDVVYLLQSNGVPAAPVQSIGDRVQRDPQLRHRKTFDSQTHHPLIGTKQVEGFPAKLASGGWEVRRHGPMIGQDNDYVLGELLGLSKSELAAREQQALFWPKNMARKGASH